MTDQKMMWCTSNVKLDKYEKQIDRIIEKLEIASSLADELAEKDPDASINDLVQQLKNKLFELDEFSAAQALVPLFTRNGEIILKMISAYLRG